MNLKKSKIGEDSIRIVAIKRTFSLAIVVALFSNFSLKAQSIPETPEPPRITTSTSSSHSVSIDDSDDSDDSDDIRSNSSVSISKTNDSYKFRASYHKSKDDKVKRMLLDQLGKSKLKINGNTYLWTDSTSGDEVFECKLTKGHLRMLVDTDVASKAFVEKINKLGSDLKYLISGTDSKIENVRTAERARREVERAERELARAKRELELAKLEGKRVKDN